jgi:hypothetical protein
MTNFSDLKRVIAALAGVLGSPHFPKGDLAELRRMTYDTPPLPFWRVLYDYVPEVFAYVPVLYVRTPVRSPADR